MYAQAADAKVVKKVASITQKEGKTEITEGTDKTLTFTVTLSCPDESPFECSASTCATTEAACSDECTPNQCLNGAQCVDGVNAFTCECAAGFSGQNCETNIDECASNQCLNGAQCVDGVNDYSCTCQPGFEGDNCQVSITPVLNPISDQIVNENGLVNFTATATIPGDNGTPIYSLEDGKSGNLPGGASIDPNTGLFSWQTSETDGPGTVTFDVVVTNSSNAGLTDRKTVSVQVAEVNSPPTLNPINDTSVEASTALSFAVTSADPDIPANTLSYAIDSASATKGMAINAGTGAFTWTPTSAHAGTHPITVTATDDGNPSLSDTFTFSVEVTLSITLDMIGDQSISENSLLTFSASATVPGESAPPVYSLEGAVPNGASIDPSTGVFSWTTDESDGPGSYVFDVVATRSDNAAVTDRETISIGVFESNSPPALNPINDTSVEASTVLSFAVVSADPDIPANTLSYAIDSASAAKGMAINTGTGAFTWTPTSAHAGTHPITVTATDDGNPSLSGTLTFNIDVTRPDYCADSPCQNGGQCTNGETEAICSCAAGYAGVTCQVAIPPSGGSVEAESTEVKSQDTVVVSANNWEGATDSGLTYTWSATCDGEIGNGEFEINKKEGKWTAPQNETGEEQTCTLSVEVTDEGNKAKSTSSVNVSVAIETKPSKLKTIAGQNASDKETISLTVNDNETLKFKVTAELGDNTSVIYGWKSNESLDCDIDQSTGDFTCDPDALSDKGYKKLNVDIFLRNEDGEEQDSKTVEINVIDVDEPPVVSGQLFNVEIGLTVGESYELDLSQYVTDDKDSFDNGELSAVVESGPGFGRVTISPSGILRFSANERGEGSISFIATDTNEGSVTGKVAITVFNGAPKGIDGELKVFSGVDNEINLSDYFSYPDKDELTYDVTLKNDSSSDTISISGSTLTFATSKHEDRTQIISVTAVDSNGSSGEANLTLEITGTTGLYVAKKFDELYETAGTGGAVIDVLNLNEHIKSAEGHEVYYSIEDDSYEVHTKSKNRIGLIFEILNDGKLRYFDTNQSIQANSEITIKLTIEAEDSEGNTLIQNITIKHSPNDQF